MTYVKIVIKAGDFHVVEYTDNNAGSGEKSIIVKSPDAGTKITYNVGDEHITVSSNVMGRQSFEFITKK